MNVQQTKRLSTSGRRALIKRVSRTVALVAGLACAGHAWAQAAWPSSRTVRIINPAAPGGSSDPLARIVIRLS